MVDILIAALIVLPLVATFLLKSNSAVAYLVICAGFVVSTSAVGGLKQLLNQMDLSVTETTLALIILLLPLILTLLLIRGAPAKGFKFIMQLVVAACAGALLALSIAPLLNATAQIRLADSAIWQTLQSLQAPIIGAGALLSLLVIWFGGLAHHGKKHK